MRPDSEPRRSPASAPGWIDRHPSRADGERSAPRASRMWLWIVAAFALQLTAWLTWFVIASHHRVAEVPLETAGGDKR